MIKTKVLRNPSDKPIVDYRIEEAVFDQDGEPMIDPLTNRPKWSGKTLEWSLKPDETAEFPAYVADILKDRFGFLEEVKEKPTDKPVEEAKQKPTGDFVCKHCGQAFGSQKGLGLHIGTKHFDKIK